MSFFQSDTAYDNFMGRYSMRLAPKFADFAGIEPRMSVIDVGAGHRRARSRARSPRRERRRGRSGAALRYIAAAAAALRSPFTRPRPRTFRGLTSDSMPRLRSLSSPSWTTPPRASRRCAASSVPAASSPCACGIATGWRCSPPCNRTQAALSADAPTTEGRTRYRTRDEIESLFGEGFEGLTTELARGGVASTAASRSSGLRSTAVPGRRECGFSSLDDDSSRPCARGALPPGRRADRSVRPRRPCLGDARYARVRTLMRSAPVPTSVTSTSSSRSTNST